MMNNSRYPDEPPEGYQFQPTYLQTQDGDNIIRDIDAPRASFGQRFGAYFIDELLFDGLASILGLLISIGIISTVVVISILFITGISYYIIMVGRGQTLGGKVVSIKLIDANGNPPGYRRAFIRFLVQIFSGIFFIGYLWVLWDKDKQTLHDKVAGTICISLSKASYYDQAFRKGSNDSRIGPLGVVVILALVIGAGWWLLSTPTIKPADPIDHTLLTNYSAGVNCLAWSPDGKVIATGSNDKTVRLWSSNGKALNTLSGHTEAVQSLAWSPDSKILATGSEDATIRLWSVDGKPLATMPGHTNRVSNLAWSGDGKTLVSASFDGTVRLWSPDGKPISLLLNNVVGGAFLAWSPDGKILATQQSVAGVVQLWSAGGKPLTTLHTAPTVTKAVWSHDSKTLAIGTTVGLAPNEIQLWSTDGKLLTVLTKQVDWSEALAWSPDDKILTVAANNGTVHFLSPDGTNLATLPGQYGNEETLAWSPDSRMLATATSSGTVRLWLPNGDLQAILKKYTEAVSLAWSPDGKILVMASTSPFDPVQIWSR
jgi:WD40 repeat protein